MDKKIMSKLTASIMALLLAASLAVTASYAWMTLSGDPEVDGMRITIGGSNTVLVAADMTYVEDDGSVSHYPGAFGTDLNFLQYDSYDYLSELAGLLPVSTSDGVYWFLPDYYSLEDSKVQEGTAVSGQIKDVSEFITDSSLKYANITRENKEDAAGGHYIYLDFWVVAPVDGYKLRVSTGGENEIGGSFVVSLMEPAEADSDGDGIADSYILQAVDETTAATLRIGFLVNEDGADSGDVIRYINSESYSDQYRYLIGQYQSPGERIELYSAARNRFTIYEPNGDLHPSDADQSGSYQITAPLGIKDGVIQKTDISDILTVQKTSIWRLAADGTETMLAQEFQTAVIGKSFGSSTLPELFDLFYRQRLQGQLAAYLNNGQFISSTQNLYAATRASGGTLDGEAEVMQEASGATSDIYITTLQKNAPQRIRMFIWIEGQDADCASLTSTSGFAVNIELAGSNES